MVTSLLLAPARDPRLEISFSPAGSSSRTRKGTRSSSPRSWRSRSRRRRSLSRTREAPASQRASSAASISAGRRGDPYAFSMASTPLNRQSADLCRPSRIRTLRQSLHLSSTFSRCAVSSSMGRLEMTCKRTKRSQCSELHDDRERPACHFPKEEKKGNRRIRT